MSADRRRGGRSEEIKGFRRGESKKELAGLELNRHVTACRRVCCPRHGQSLCIPTFRRKKNQDARGKDAKDARAVC